MHRYRIRQWCIFEGITPHTIPMEQINLIDIEKVLQTRVEYADSRIQHMQKTNNTWISSQ